MADSEYSVEFSTNARSQARSLFHPQDVLCKNKQVSESVPCNCLNYAAMKLTQQCADGVVLGVMFVSMSL